jgi:hypothetical protein
MAKDRVECGASLAARVVENVDPGHAVMTAQMLPGAAADRGRLSVDENKKKRLQTVEDWKKSSFGGWRASGRQVQGCAGNVPPCRRLDSFCDEGRER